MASDKVLRVVSEPCAEICLFQLRRQRIRGPEVPRNDSRPVRCPCFQAVCAAPERALRRAAPGRGHAPAYGLARFLFAVLRSLRGKGATSSASRRSRPTNARVKRLSGKFPPYLLY